MKMTPIVLGSQSPRRRELLQMAEIPFEVLVSDVDESFGEEEDVWQVPQMLAERKAAAIQEKFHVTNRWVLTADTVVILDQQIKGKPTDKEDAVNILTALAGRKHTVVSGVCLLRNEEKIVFSDATDVYFNPLTEAQIRYFVEKYSPLDKAGAYAIQEWIGLVGVQRIDGCFYNVMGLPVPKLYPHLMRLT